MVGTDKEKSFEAITWPQWDEFASKIIKNGNETQDSELADRYHQRTGAHKHSYELTKKINSRGDTMYIYNKELLTKLKDVVNISYKSENRRIRDLQKVSEIQLRQCMTTKNTIF